MNRKLGSTALAVLSGGAAVALAAVPAAAQATSAGAVGGITTSISGVPAHLPVGGGFTVTITVSSTSSYYIVAEDLYIGMWNLAPESSPTKGIAVTWKDPATGAWRGSDNIDPNGGWGLMPGGQVEIQPHGTLSYQVHIAMSGAAKQGTERFSCTGVSAWSLVDGNGNPPPTTQTLDYNQAQTTFTFGSAGGGNPGGGSRTSAPATGPADGSLQAAPSPSPTPSSAAPSPSPPPSASPQGQSPSPQGSSPGAPPATPGEAAVTAPPSTAPSQVDTTATGQSGNSVLPLALVGLLIVTGTAVGVLTRRSRNRY